MFTEKSLKLLRAMKRHNDREWFRAHRDEYERHVRGPMLALVGRMAEDLRSFAPDLVASPKVSLYRVYRDTRFSPDKSPLKTHIGAIFPRRGLPRHESAGFYVEVAPEHALVAGGLYLPQPHQLRAVRGHIAANARRFRAIIEAAPFRRAFGDLEGERLQRVPPLYPRDHPAAEYLKMRQFLASRVYEPEFAVTRGFYAEVVRRFRQMAPLIRFLNEPLVALPAPLNLQARFAPATRLTGDLGSADDE